MNAKPSASVTAAGVVAILGSLVTAFFSCFPLFSLLITSYLATAHQPHHFDWAYEGVSLVLLIPAVFGVFVGFGLFHLKNWARISVLVWAPMAILLSSAAALSLIFTPVPLPPPMMHSWAVYRAIIVFFVALPVPIAIWWLVLFNRGKVILLFLGAVLKKGTSTSEDSATPGEQPF